VYDPFNMNETVATRPSETARQLDEQQPFSLKRTRRAARKGLAKILLGNRSAAWVFFSVSLVWPAFVFFSSFGRLTHLPQIQHENHIAALFFTFCFAVSNLGFGSYERESRFQTTVFLQRSLLSLFSAVTLASLTMYFVFFKQVGRYSMLYGAFGSYCIFVLVVGLTYRWLRRYAYRFILLGPNSSLMSLLRTWDFRNAAAKRKNPPASKFEISEFAIPPVFTDGSDEESQELFDAYRAFFRDHSLCDLVLSDVFDPHDRRLSRATMAALQSGVRVISAPEFYAEFSHRYPVEILPPSWAIHAGFDVNHPIRNLLKRTFDFSLAAILLVLLAPLNLFIAAAVYLTSPGPAFYIQERRGRFSRSFKMVKFRTMVDHPEGKQTTAESDPRITWVGRILRPLHLDELPQIWNILAGDMSFVGPRPESRVIADTARGYSALYELRHMVRPGLSGLAQILQGKTGDSPEVLLEKLSYDLYYIRNHSLLLDFWIMFRTIFVLAKRAW
jgi:exopolysaccharide biosynthesis polyprenyl glycosylphosphotransferase